MVRTAAGSHLPPAAVHRHRRPRGALRRPGPITVAGSGDKQAKAKLCRVEIDEVAVAFGPPA